MSQHEDATEDALATELFTHLPSVDLCKRSRCLVDDGKALKIICVPLDSKSVRAVSEFVSRSTRLQRLRLGLNRLGALDVTVLAEAIRRSVSLMKVNIGDNSIGVDGARTLAATITSHVTCLRLSCCDLRDRGITVIAKVLAQSTVLADVDVGGNQVGEPGWLAITAAIEQNSSLQRLNLSAAHVPTAEIAQRLGAALASNVTLAELDLCNCSLTPTSMCAFVVGLTRNRTLRRLNIDFNPIGDVGMRALAEALGGHPTLEALSLRVTEVGVIGARALATVMPSITQMRHVKLGSNGRVGAAGCRAIGEAVQRCSDQMLYVDLDSCGADADVLDEVDRRCARNLVTLWSKFERAARTGDRRAGETLAAAILDSWTINDAHRKPWKAFVRRGGPWPVVDVNESDSTGFSLLHDAFVRADLVAIRSLLLRGCKAHLLDDEKMLPEQYWQGDRDVPEDVVQLLATARARVGQTTKAARKQKRGR